MSSSSSSNTVPALPPDLPPVQYIPFQITSDRTVATTNNSSGSSNGIFADPHSDASDVEHRSFLPAEADTTASFITLSEMMSTGSVSVGTTADFSTAQAMTVDSAFQDEGHLISDDASDNEPSQSVPREVTSDSSSLTFSQNGPNGIPQASGDATQKLYELYSKRNVPCAKTQFVSWKKGPGNALQWTAAFVCPRTGECFVAGTLLPNPPTCVAPIESVAPGMAWYGTKKMAEKAASGRALDSFAFRENTFGGSMYRFCREQPVPAAPSPPPHRLFHVPNHIPGEQRLEIQLLQEQCLFVMSKTPSIYP